MIVRRAIISVADKTGIVGFAGGLKKLGVDIIGTGGTANALKKGGVGVVDIADYTCFPEILDGRLKTLHPLIHGGILGKRGDANHKKEMDKNGIRPIDMVVVNLYPFEETVAMPDSTLEGAIENIDIGGPTMLRAAAKNYKDVAVVVDPEDYERILKELQGSGGSLSEETTFALAQKVFATTARYDGAICNYLNSLFFERSGAESRRAKLGFPSHLALTYEKLQDLRYGENPHQKAAFYREYKITEPCVAAAEQLHGKELSFNNIMDADAAIELVKEFAGEIFVAIIKHTNPCGAATSEKSLADAFAKARQTDPASAFGGIVGLNRPVDEETAKAISGTFFEVIVAPDFSADALKILKKKKDIRLLRLPGLDKPACGKGWTTRKVVGGLLVEEMDLGQVDVKTCKVVTKRRPTEDEYKALQFAWKICKHVKSNAIVYASVGQLLGVGAGQMSRIDSARIAHMKMKEMSLTHHLLLVSASDAFFPFRDGIDAVAKAGASAVIQPGGSVRDEEAIAAADEHGLAMVFTGMRHFRH